MKRPKVPKEAKEATVVGGCSLCAILFAMGILWCVAFILASAIRYALGFGA